MNNFYKALDYYRKLHRSSAQRACAVKEDKFIWLIDGYMAHKIPENEMELNPKIFREFPGNFRNLVDKAESGVHLSSTGLIRKKNDRSLSLIPFLSDSDNAFTVWFQKFLLDTFPNDADLYGTSPLDPAAVKDRGEIIGVILPVRNPNDIDIRLFI